VHWLDEYAGLHIYNFHKGSLLTFVDTCMLAWWFVWFVRVFVCSFIQSLCDAFFYFNFCRLVSYCVHTHAHTLNVCAHVLDIFLTTFFGVNSGWPGSPKRGQLCYLDFGSLALAELVHLDISCNFCVLCSYDHAHMVIVRTTVLYFLTWNIFDCSRIELTLSSTKSHRKLGLHQCPV